MRRGYALALTLAICVALLASDGGAADIVLPPVTSHRSLMAAVSASGVALTPSIRIPRGNFRVLFFFPLRRRKLRRCIVQHTTCPPPAMTPPPPPPAACPYEQYQEASSGKCRQCFIKSYYINGRDKKFIKAETTNPATCLKVMAADDQAVCAEPRLLNSPIFARAEPYRGNRIVVRITSKGQLPVRRITTSSLRLAGLSPITTGTLKPRLSRGNTQLTVWFFDTRNVLNSIEKTMPLLITGIATQPTPIKRACFVGYATLPKTNPPTGYTEDSA